MTETARGGSHRLRLSRAFVAVALLAIGLLVALAIAVTLIEVPSRASRQRAQLIDAIAVGAVAAWDEHDSWASAELGPVVNMAHSAGASVEIRDTADRIVAVSPGFAAAAPQYSEPVVVRGQRLGVALMWFTSSGLGGEGTLEATLLLSIAVAAGGATLVALGTGLVVARRISRPVDQLIAVTRSVAGGDHAARAGDIRAPRELRELAAAFDQMADSLDREDQLRRDLVAGVAHELRTPVAVLQAGHEALLDGVTEPTPDELASLRDEVLRLARMIDELQTLAAADAAALHLAPRRCDLAGIAAAAAGSLAHKFEAAGIELDQRLSGVPVRADPHWLHQLITNLLTNALKFTPAGGTVTIVTRQDGTDAVLEVADTGIGIAAEELPRVFDRFWRGRGAAGTSGTGIGLAVADLLARAHRGRLTAASTEGKGTTMTLTLPRA